MTLDEALELARNRPGRDELAVWVRDTLGEDQPCSMVEPEVVIHEQSGEVDRHPTIERFALVEIPKDLAGAWLPDETRAIAVMLLRAADEAEGWEP